MTATFIADLDRNGFAVVPNVISEQTADRLAAVMARVGAGYGRRNILSELDEVQAVARDPAVHSLVDCVLSPEARAVRGLFFDKTASANWRVDWHQDRTIAVRDRHDAPGFALWTVKAGVPHVQPPVVILEQMLTVRLHLDAAGNSNGPLRVIAGSHRAGFIPEDQINDWAQQHSPVTCLVPRGGALLMRPLLLHASPKATGPAHRRVLHLEYAAQPLPGPLQWAFSV